MTYMQVKRRERIRDNVERVLMVAGVIFLAGLALYTACLAYFLWETF